MTTLVFFCLHKLKNSCGKKKFCLFCCTQRKGGKKRGAIFNGWFLEGMHQVKRVSLYQMREEADYPATFCVWDQDQEANSPFGDERVE